MVDKIENPELNSAADFGNRFIDLVKEAKAHGVIAVAIVMDWDLLQDQTELTFVRDCPFPIAIGLAEAAKVYFSRMESSEE